MAEYINREELINTLDCRDDFDEILQTIRELPTADVQPTAVVEHIKQRILETAFNNGGIYSEVAEDIEKRIDFWVDEFLSETTKG